MISSKLRAEGEKIPFHLFHSKIEGSAFVAREIASMIRAKNERGEQTVLGLATGSSPLLVYQELIRIHQEEGLHFGNVIAFNLDEYYPMQTDDPQSYNHFMYEHFFKHIDIKKENIHIPDGTLATYEVDEYGAEYDQKIEEAGGIDVQLLGIGRSGHIGFNEPGSAATSTTRMVKLDERTLEDAANDFGTEEDVPLRAITMGVKNILGARKIFLMAWGEGKADILQKAVEEPFQSDVPASFLQNHDDVKIIADHAAASQLSRFKTPWLSGTCDWSDPMKKKAVIWLSGKSQKPILKLTDADYKKKGLTDLLKTEGSAYQLNIKIYNQIQKTITGWPGGKPGSKNKKRPVSSRKFPKKIIIFSPHPDDDVISMGGTLQRLAEQGHEVHVVYQTSGNIAVFDDDAQRFLDFVLGFSKKFSLAESQVQDLHRELSGSISAKSNGGTDTEQILDIKGLIRRGEAIAACRFCNIKTENIHFLDMPFYETGRVEKKPIGEEDIRIILDLLEKIKPDELFAAGDLQDPHGTHAVCLKAIFEAVDRLKNESWMDDLYFWLYRGAWQEWAIEDIEMAVPISPEELMKKRKAIFKHQSQKDSPVFPGKDQREFWQRAEARNRETARLYDELGLAEYEAMEAFKRYFVNCGKNETSAIK